MARVVKSRIANLFRKADSATSTYDKGRALEDAVCYLFGRVPGIAITHRNQHNLYGSEEIDVALWNNQSKKGLHFLPYMLLVECKNWSAPVGAPELSWFAGKLRTRSLDHGFLVAANGITGDATALRSAHHVLASSLQEGLRIVVITREDMETIACTTQLVELVKVKLCELLVLDG